MSKPNRFADLMKDRQSDESILTDETSRESAEDDYSHTGHTVSARGRPRDGKRSNPDYKQISALIRKDTHRAVVRVLLDDGESRDVSDLLQELLQGWLARR